MQLSSGFPGEQHYRASYLGKSFQRLASYRQQLQYVVKSSPTNVLLIGKGDGFVAKTLCEMGIAVVVLDVDSSLNPDVCASVEKMPLDNQSFDVSICCQVLEHLPFEKLELCLTEIRRVTRNRLVMSVPDNRRFFLFRLRFARFNLEWQGSLSRLRPRKIPAARFEQHGHYWEIGWRGYGICDVERVITNAGWKLMEHRRVPDLAWHTFFYCAPGESIKGAIAPAG